MLPLPPDPTYTWEPAAGRYRSVATGRWVTFQSVREEAIERVVSASEARMVAITNQRVSGALTTEQWREAMRQEIKTLHVESAMAASGGRAQMNAADWGAVGAKVKAQYRYLDNFAGQIDSGAQKLDGTIVSRTRLYAHAGRATWEETRRRVRNEQGWQEEKRILGYAEHCEGCLEWAGKWAAIGALPPIGSQQCKVRCHCYYIYRRRNRRGAWEYSRE